MRFPPVPKQTLSHHSAVSLVSLLWEKPVPQPAELLLLKCFQGERRMSRRCQLSQTRGQNAGADQLLLLSGLQSWSPHVQTVLVSTSSARQRGAEKDRSWKKDWI